MSSVLQSLANAIPSLSSIYSGVPERLAREAIDARDRLRSQKTVPDSVPRKTWSLPPDVDQTTFDAAIAEIRQRLGSDNVEVNEKPLLDGWYMQHPNTHDAYHIVDQEEMTCSAVIYPSTTEEVQMIVKWANKHIIPVYPISMGRNLGYGGSAPRVPGSVVIDLGRRMDKILNIDAENASCMVEPGVSYFKLYEEIQARKLPLWIDCPDLGGGSVLGNAIDRGVGYTRPSSDMTDGRLILRLTGRRYVESASPSVSLTQNAAYGDHFANHCGMEIVLPDGSVMRTGLGAMPGKDGADNECWQSFQAAYGPYVDGIFSQSNYGIVTKMGFWLMPESDHQSYMITFPRDEDLGQIVEIIKPLAQKRILGNIPQLRHVIQELAITGKPRSYWYTGTGSMPRDIIAKHAATQPCGDVAWCFYGTQYGDRASITAQLDLVKTAFAAVPGMKFYLPQDMPSDHYLHSRSLVCSGTPVLKELDWLNWQPNAAHLFFSPILPTRARDAEKAFSIIARLHKKHGFDLLPTCCIAGREMHTIVNIVYDRYDPDAKRRATACMRDMIRECAREGYGEYRTHLLFMDQVAESYSWGGGALRKFNETIKDALDPNSILSPGRNGIWGKRFRGKGWELLDGDKRDILRDGVRPSKL